MLLALGVGAACTSSPVAPTNQEGGSASPGLTITSQPQSQTISPDSTASLSVQASGTSPMRYQWYRGRSGDTDRPISGASADRFVTPRLPATTRYWVRVMDGSGSIDSATATITVRSSGGGGTAPVITSQPQRGTVQSGQPATLRVRADGAGPLRYQWYRGSRRDTSTPMDGATRQDYTTPPLSETTSYWVRVSNAAGSVDSDTATVTVEGAPPAGPAPPANPPAGQPATVGHGTQHHVAAGRPDGQQRSVRDARGRGEWLDPAGLPVVRGSERKHHLPGNRGDLDELHDPLADHDASLLGQGVECLWHRRLTDGDRHGGRSGSTASATSSATPASGTGGHVEPVVRGRT